VQALVDEGVDTYTFVMPERFGDVKIPGVDIDQMIRDKELEPEFGLSSAVRRVWETMTGLRHHMTITPEEETTILRLRPTPS